MTKKNANKIAARARQQTHGGKYQHHLRQVGGGGGRPASDDSARPTVAIVPRFDLKDARYKTTRLVTSAHRDPIRPFQIINGERSVLVWIFPISEGIAGWRLEVNHREGSWPLRDDERAALERWLEAFAKREWPDRNQVWPATYVAMKGAWEPMRRDVLAGSLGGVVDSHYVVLRPDGDAGESFDDALEEARREARERRDLLEVGIRRGDRPGHPWICTWKRKAMNDPWTFEWSDGADDPSAQPLTLREVSEVGERPADTMKPFREMQEETGVPGGSGAKDKGDSVRKTLVRSCNPLAFRPGPIIEVNSSTPCTRAHPENESSHLTVTRQGLRAYDDDNEDWPGQIVTLGACAIGDRVFADLGVDVTPPHIWPLFEVVG